MPTRRALDPYAILGLSRDASPLQVARAHRVLAKRHHPDLHEGASDAAERMRRINEAWSILSNPAQRADYDRAHPINGIVVQGGHWVGSRA
ncbi:MAG: J domain-containing protein, partial [Chloroflexi bacterium]|nr:J domain-containing protein [Chloroflexota bacterium]